MPRSSILLACLAVLTAGVCVSLGLWQLERYEARRGHNALVAQRRLAPPVPVQALPRDTAGLQYRRVLVTGTPDYAHELVLSNRVRRGSPGVNILTPVRLPGSDTAVLVNRGWVYSPNASTVQLERWREGSTLSVTGYVQPLVRDTRPLPSGANPRVLRRADAERIARLLPYPVLPYYVVALSEPDRRETATSIARLDLPALSGGSHLGYAVQWFSFALMAVGITAYVLWRTRSLLGRGGARAARR